MSRWSKKRSIMRRYDLTADIYDMRYAEEQIAKYKVALDSLKTEKLGLALDAGCGTGLLFGCVAGRADVAVGLDISREILHRAKKRIRSFENVHLICADVDAMPFRNSIFNNVFAVTVIQNSPDPICTLNSINQVSEFDAAIVVTGLKRIFTKDIFENLLHDAGLKIRVLRAEDNLKCYVAICAKNHQQNCAKLELKYI